ncbi:MAG: DUF4340 domain-containing protein [bacterium]
MKWTRSMIALGLAVMLGFIARSMHVKVPDSGPVRHMLLADGALDPDRVDRIELVREGRRSVFERTPGGETSSWMQTEPVVHAADGWAVRQLITRLMKTESVRRVEGSTVGSESAAENDEAGRKALADAGLLPPVATLVLREEGIGGAAPREIVVELGRRSLAGRAFARVVSTATSPSDAGRVATGYDVIDGALHEFALERDVRDFRRRELFPDLGDVGRVSFEAGGRRVVLVRAKSGYRLEAPVATRADRQQAEELLDALRRARSAGFIVDDPREPSVYGLEPPAARIEIESPPSGAKASLPETSVVRRAIRIGDAVSIGAQDRFGLVEGTSSVVRVPAAEIAAIVPRVERLIDAVASAVRPRDVARIEIVLGGGDSSTPTSPRERIELVREVDGWSATRVPAGEAAAPIAGRVSTEAIERLLSALGETRAGSVEIAAFPQELSVAEVVLRGFAGEALDTVRVARREGGQTILENGDGVLRIHGSIDLPLSIADLGFVANTR